MALLVLGLALFIGTHSVRIFADDWRSRQIERIGMPKWKGAYAAISIIGLVLIIWGYAMARLDPVYLWFPPVWTRHLAALLTIPAFILIVATYVPATVMKARIGHPMVAGVKIWAFSHLIANGTLADVLLFGTFMAWAIVSFASARKRDRRQGRVPVTGKVRNDAIAILIGLVAWFVFARYLHVMLFGIAPFG